MRIKLLDTILANQIAAGEVVDRPASVVKELLENSIDAKANQIDIYLEKGGMQCIRITDNGHGIHHEDLALALSRHGTSKIHQLQDLEQVRTLGFRGEALASICSVSRLTLSSRSINSSDAFQISAEGSVKHAIQLPASHPQGTTIEIRDLFFNTPARKKFLRSEKTEFNHIQEILQRLLLSNFEIKFSLEHNQQKKSVFPRATSNLAFEQRIQKICGKDFMDHVIKFEREIGGLRLWGWMALPTYVRNFSDLQYFYVNGRIVRDRLISHAVRLGYRQLITADHHPCYVIYLEIDPSQVDVNVHPTKHEVRFRENRLIHDFIASSIYECLNNSNSSNHLKKPTENLHVAENFSIYAVPTNTDQPNEKNNTCTQNKLSATKPLAILHDEYLLIQIIDALLIVNIQRASQELYQQQITAKIAANNLNTLPLLIPQTVAISPDDLKNLIAQKEILEKIGIKLSAAGENLCMVRELPYILNGVDVKILIAKLISQFTLPEKNKKHADRLENIISEVAFLASGIISAKKTLDSMQELIMFLEKQIINSTSKPPDYCYQVKLADLKKILTP